MVEPVDAETLPRERLRAVQLERLTKQVSHAIENVPFYREWAASTGFEPSAVRSLDDVKALPFTTKAELRQHYPFGLCGVPLSEVVRIHATSGTTGKPTIGPYSRRDMKLWSEVMARTFTAVGVTRDDVLHNAYGYGLFTGGLGFALGAESIGCATVPVSGGLTSRQLMLMEDLGATVLACTPSYALVLAEEAEARSIDVRSRMKLRVGMFGAEPWSEAMRQEIESRLGLRAYDVYGLAEIIGPGVAVECESRDGLHLFEDHFLPELIDPETEEPLPVGEDGTGELVLTALTREALPLLRYRTRDRVRLTRAPCACGRTLVRMTKPLGRTDDMLVVRGVNVFPSQIEAALLEVEGLAPQYVVVVDRERDRLDTLEIRVEATRALQARGAGAVEAVEAEALGRVREALGIAARVKVVEPEAIDRSQGKAVRVVDRREL